jgi:S-adenosylmethionine hydrolase
LETEVTWVDRFGNVQLAARPGDIPAAIAEVDRLSVIVTSAARLARDGELLTARRVQVFADLRPGELGLIVDSYGHLALCLYAANAAERLGTREQDRLALGVTPQPEDGAGS